MKEYSVYITPAALEDMESIYNYISVELQSVYNASKQYDRISDAILTLDSMPERCPLFDNEPEYTMGIRRLIVDNYLVCYIIQDEQVTVTNVLYGASDVHAILSGE